MIKSLTLPLRWIAKKAIVVEEWLFTEEERAPMGFIYLFFMNIAISTAICLFILAYKGVM
jgi:hypothetical protein|tara:strand:- start:186 stop:365 length:180 start_codon:yes stop_codon:yes gene_type:complete